jgi:hypothetical protein
MQVVPLLPQPNQTVQVQLGGQPCTLNIFQQAYGLFMTVYVGQTLIVASVICENLNRIVRSTYLGFSGDFCFFDTQGTTDPIYTGLGDSEARYQLIYLEAADVAVLASGG